MLLVVEKDLKLLFSSKGGPVGGRGTTLRKCALVTR
jgi:hypothetical protein